MPGPGTSTRRIMLAVLAVAAVGLAGACTGERPELTADDPTTTTTTEASTTTTVVERRAQVAEVSGDAINVFGDATSGEPVAQLTAAAITSAPGIPIVLLVKDTGDNRLEVYLPTAPAGSTGWVDADTVTLSAVDHRIEVDVAAHRLRVYDGAEVVVDEPAGIGPNRPIAVEGSFLTELVQPPDDDGEYGAYVYGLSGSPPVREGLEGGGVVAIHGTDDPDLVGADMPSGSIALAADVLVRLVQDVGLPLGTPVEVIEGP